jgi:hypothetical protein
VPDNGSSVSRLLRKEVTLTRAMRLEAGVYNRATRLLRRLYPRSAAIAAARVG